MASLRTTSRLVASSRSLFRPATLARSYATVESGIQVSKYYYASTPALFRPLTLEVCIGARR